MIKKEVSPLKGSRIYKVSRQVDYEEIRALYLELKDKVDMIESEELERDIRIIETHWINVYELLMAAFAVVSLSHHCCFKLHTNYKYISSHDVITPASNVALLDWSEGGSNND